MPPSSTRILSIFLIGPLIGSLVYIVIGFLITPGQKSVTDFISIAPTGIFLFWFLGLFPALIAAIFWAFLPVPCGIWPRVGLAVFVGLSAVIVCIVAIVAVLNLQVPADRFVDFVPMGVSGAVAMLATAVPRVKKIRPGKNTNGL